MIEHGYPYAKEFQRRFLALLVRDPQSLSSIIRAEYFTVPTQVDIARIVIEVYEKHPEDRLSELSLKQLVKSSLSRHAVENWSSFEREIERTFSTKITDRSLLIEKATEFAKEARHREALVRAEHALNAKNYDKFYQAIEQAKLPDGTIRQSGATELPLFSFHRLLGTEFKNNKTYLVETLVPAGGAIMSYGLPKGLKSWFSTAVALDAAIGRCKALNYFDGPRPVRVLLVQVEDPADRTRDRLQRLHVSRLFRRNPAPINFKIITRCPLNLSDRDWIARLETMVAKHKTELIIFDVFRRLFRGNVNSPEDTAAFFETVDTLRDRYGLAVWIVHHSNKNADTAMITKALGSINITGWPDVVLYFKNKQQSGGVTTCNLEIETKDELIEGELKVILDDDEQPMLRVEKAKSAEDKLQKAMSLLNDNWTVKDLAKTIDLKYAGAYKTLQDWLQEGIAVLVKKGSKGHRARYSFRQITSE